MSELKFNINDSIRVKLTDYGKACHRKNFEDFWSRVPGGAPVSYTPPEIDSEGFSKFVFWSFMNTFGEFMHMGLASCIEGNVIYLENRLTQSVDRLTQDFERLNKDFHRIRKAVAGLIGVDSREELVAMEAAIRMAVAPDKDKANVIDAIQALIDTIP